MGNFDFLRNYPQFRMFADAAIEAEKVLNTSPAMSAVGSRKAFELAVKWVYSADRTMGDPPNGLQALIHKPEFANFADRNILKRAQTLIKFGNNGVHTDNVISHEMAVESLRILFSFIKWVDYNYGDSYDPSREFDPGLIPSVHVDLDYDEIRKTHGLLKERDDEIEELRRQVADLSEKYTAERDKNHREREYTPDDLSEFDTRKLYIDFDLKRCGWILEGPDANVVEEFKVDDMEGVKGQEGFADYVLFGKDGLPLAVIEAKKTSVDPNVGRVQAKLYADCLERRFKRRPMMFTTNGFDTYFWDDVSGPQRPVSGVFGRLDLQRLMNRRTESQDLMRIPINDDITDRPYQKEAIRAVCRDVMDGIRKHLIVMATGTGKTRTASSLVDVLSRGGHVTNVLFLADRTALVSQAKDDFELYLPDMTLCNLCTNKKDANARIVFSTYPTILNAIDDERSADGSQLFTPAHFDLIIVDESHRSIFRKYRAIFDYFDAHIIGLTATPKTEVERNTYDFFEKDAGVPTYAYDYETAVYTDHVLVPYYNYEIKTKFLDQGITYDDLSESDKERYEDDFAEDGYIPDEIPSAALNRFVFNEKTVDMVLQDLMQRGIRIDSGEHIGKTIIFAQNKNHAEFILERFNKLYPHYKGTFAERVTCEDSYAQNTIKRFKYGHDLKPQIVISVDMMDTGIDVRDCVNLVFFKLVRSKTKFWQMIGRGTRLYDEGIFIDSIDGQYSGKRRFLIFDYCGNFEFFRENTEGYESTDVKSLSQKIFENCVRIIYHLQDSEYSADRYQEFRSSLVDLCHGQILALNDELTVVRLKRQYVEKYRNKDSFDCLSESDRIELIDNIAPIVVYEGKDESAKYFDNLMFALIAATLEESPVSRLQRTICNVATDLKGKASIPQVRERLPVLDEVLSDDLWIASDVVAFERVRQEVRDLMQFLDRESIRPIITSLSDEVVGSMEGQGSTPGYDFEEYRKKVNRYIFEHQDEGAIYKLNHNIPLNKEDVSEISHILTHVLGSEDDYFREFGEAEFGETIRRIVKLDHEATMKAFSKFINDASLNQEQIQFVYKIIQYLENEGVMDIGDLMKSPFDKPVSFIRMFDKKTMTELIDVIKDINNNATAIVDQ